jgi:hypothetical protein
MKRWIWLAGIAWLVLGSPLRALSNEHTVYQVFRPVDLGFENFTVPKDIYVSVGAEDGVRKGAKLDVFRKVASFNHLTQQHVGDHLVPVARVKVIHVDQRTAIARLDQFVSLDKEPALYPQAIMIGDQVQIVK